MRAAITLALILALATVPVASQPCPLGYTSGVQNLTRTMGGFIYDDLVDAQQANGIQVTLTMVSFSPDYTLLRDALPSIVNQWPGITVMLDMTSLLYKRRTGGSFDCSAYGAGTVTERHSLYHSGDGFDPANNDPGGHWQTRIANVDSAVGDFIRANIDYIVIHGEVNNSCIPEFHITSAASELRARFPGIPLVAGYPTRSDHPLTKAFPTLFPYNVDVIATWAYGVYNPLRSTDTRNIDKVFYSGGFFQPSNQLSTSTGWGDLVRRLRGPENGGLQQSVLPVMESFFGPRQSSRGWTITTLAEANTNWYRWTRVTNFKRADGVTPLRIEPVFAFLWPNAEDFLGVKSMPALITEHGDLTRCIF